MRANKHWIGVGLAVALVAFGVWKFLAWQRPGWGAYGFDPRPPGTVDDIRELAQRDDTNVLFILIDTLRAHRLGSYGYERDTSPSLNYLAATGVRFDQHLAQSSWTKCSMASLWTGLHPVRTGVLRFTHGLPQEATLPAEIFRDAGFRTTGIFRNGWVAANFGFDQGFEIYHRPLSTQPRRDVLRENPHVTLEGSDQDIMNTALEFLRAHGSERWFLYLHLMNVHQYLYDKETAVFGSDYADLYDNSILYTDGMISRFLYQVGQLGLMDRTLLVIGADHGEAFRERGLEGHARHVYRESTQVPLVLSFPFRLEQGITVRANTANIDLWPTVLDLIDLPPLPDPDGRSLVPEILAAAENVGEPAPSPPGFAHLEGHWGQRSRGAEPRVAVLDGDHRFIYETRGKRGPLEELFDRSVDARELTNVIAEKPEVAGQLRTLVESYLASEPAPWGVPASDVELNEMELNQLRALGYAVP